MCILYMIKMTVFKCFILQHRVPIYSVLDVPITCGSIRLWDLNSPEDADAEIITCWLLMQFLLQNV